MKVIIVIDSLGPGGAEKSMVDFGIYLNKVIEKVSFICLDNREINYEEELLKNGVEVKYLQESSFLKRLREFVRLVDSIQPDIIHSVLLRSNMLVRASKMFLGKTKIIQSLVNTPYSEERKKDNKLSWQKFLVAKQLDKWSARFLPSFYHPITETVFHHYKGLYWVRNNYRIIYRGRNTNHYSDTTPESREFVLINVGRQQFAKGQIVILQALKYLEETYGIRDIKLKILGLEGKSSKDLKDFIEVNNWEERVEIPGFVRDVPFHLHQASLFVFPSFYEGLGGALIEAFASRLPVVCTNLPVLEEVVGDKEGALFCDPGDFVGLGENILKLYKDPELRKNLSEYSYKRFKNSFQMDNIHSEMYKMYEDVLTSQSQKLA